MNAVRSTKISVWLPEGSTTWNWRIVLADQARRIRLEGQAEDQRQALDRAFQAAGAAEPIGQLGTG